mgnify:CR=1 FL=1
MCGDGDGVCRGPTTKSRAQLIQNMKATHKAISQGGKWAEAWAYTMLPELQESASGVSIQERATTGRWIREKALTEEAFEVATGAGARR